MPRTRTAGASLIEQNTAEVEQERVEEENWRDQSIPDFPPVEPSREDRIAELDARDERLNGNGQIRPSEQCGIVAGSGPYPGKRCTYPEHPRDQPHSWEVLSEPLAEQPGHVYDDAEDQPTLPGTPEPEQDEYSIPYESQFNGADFMAAPGLEEIALRLILADSAELEHLNGIRIRYFWKKRGGLKGGNPRLGNLGKPAGLAAYALGRPQFTLWLAADHCRDAKLTNEQIDALVFDLLCHAQRDPNDHDQYRVIGDDFSGMIATMRKYGLWQPDLRELGANVKQLGLLDGIELPTADDDEDDDDGDGDE